MCGIKKSFTNALDTVIKFLVFTIFAFFSLGMLDIVTFLSLGMSNMMVNAFNVIWQTGAFIWSMSVPYLFTARCFLNIGDFQHCYALSSLVSAEFLQECANSGISYQVCVNIIEKIPQSFLNYVMQHDLSFDPFQLLRLFPY